MTTTKDIADSTHYSKLVRCIDEQRARLVFANPVQRRLLFLSSVRTYATALHKHKLLRACQFVGLTAWIDRQAINPITVALPRRLCIISCFFLSKILHRRASGAQRICTLLGECATGLFKEKTSASARASVPV
jgi:hypothetical protein